MIRPSDLRRYVIEPVLRELELYSESAVVLLLGTAAQESHLGTYLRQVGGGPARGLFQIEPATHDDCWRNYLGARKDLAARVQRFVAPACRPVDQLEWNLAYACAIARVQYLRDKMPLPPASDLRQVAATWKRWWNTTSGKGTVDEFLANYRRLVTEQL